MMKPAKNIITDEEVREIRRLYDVEFRKTGYISALYQHIPYNYISKIVRMRVRTDVV